jgi:hypothetical protein
MAAIGEEADTYQSALIGKIDSEPPPSQITEKLRNRHTGTVMPAIRAAD